MQTLVFNTTTKTIKLIEGPTLGGTVLFEMDHVPTVKVMEDYYEVRRLDEYEKQIPVLRLPIARTNMHIIK